MYGEEKNIGLSIIGLSHRLRRKADEVAASFGEESITGVQGFIIGYIYKNMCHGNFIFQRDLEKKFGISRSTTSGILNLMEKKGLIQRCSVAHDARLKQILLTEKTQKIQKEIFRQMCEMDQKLVGTLSKEEKDQFFHIIKKLNEILNISEKKK